VVHTKVGTIRDNSYKCNLDIEITMDILRVGYQSKPEIIVLASGDIDFVPLILELRHNGIRVEVAALENTAAREIVLKCSGFISLDRYYEEYATSLNSSAQSHQVASVIQSETASPARPFSSTRSDIPVSGMPDATEV
jgi:hypothetical protein